MLIKYAAVLVALGVLAGGPTQANISTPDMDSAENAMRHHSTFGKLMNKDGTYKQIPKKQIKYSGLSNSAKRGVTGTNFAAMDDEDADCKRKDNLDYVGSIDAPTTATQPALDHQCNVTYQQDCQGICIAKL